MPRPQLAEFMNRMDENSVAIIPAAREAVRSHDLNFRYRQNSDFFYLTGFEEPEAIAVITPSKDPKYTLFLRPRDPEREIWDGRRAGIDGAKSEYGADEAFPISEFNQKLGDILNGPEKLYYRLGENAQLDETMIRQLASVRTLNRKPLAVPQTIIDSASIIHEMRVIKTDAEIEIMQRSADIAAEAHIEAMKAVRPGMMEFEIEAVVEQVFRRAGAQGPSYTSIVGAGANATILHYINNDGVCNDGDLLLLDAGAEYKGYASDITRTFPINGHFTEAQRDIYDLVLETQMSCVEMVRPGTRHMDIKNHSIEMLTEGMVRLGLLQGNPEELIKEEKYMQFYMHGLGHYLGIDVHDVGRYFVDGESRPLEPGMVMTVEPGVYISPNTKGIPEKYLGIGVRIEDDVLATETGPRVLTHKVPKDAGEIEALMAG